MFCGQHLVFPDRMLSKRFPLVLLPFPCNSDILVLSIQMGILMPASINQELKILYLIQLVGPPQVLEDMRAVAKRIAEAYL